MKQKQKQYSVWTFLVYIWHPCAFCKESRYFSDLRVICFSYWKWTSSSELVCWLVKMLFLAWDYLVSAVLRCFIIGMDFKLLYTVKSFYLTQNHSVLSKNGNIPLVWRKNVLNFILIMIFVILEGLTFKYCLTEKFFSCVWDIFLLWIKMLDERLGKKM